MEHTLDMHSLIIQGGELPQCVCVSECAVPVVYCDNIHPQSHMYMYMYLYTQLYM